MGESIILITAPFKDPAVYLTYPAGTSYLRCSSDLF